MVKGSSVPVKELYRCIGVILILNCSAFAGQQIGVYGLQSFTKQELIPSSAGVGAYVQKDLSNKISLRFSVQKGFDTDTYVKTIRYGGVFSMPGDTIHDYWNQESSMSAYDVTVLFKPFARGPVNLALGAGLGFVSLDFSAVGRRSGYEMSDEAKFRMGFSVLLDFEIAPINSSPLLFHVTIRERIAPDNRAYPTDSMYYLAGSISSAEITLAVGLNLQ